MSSADDRFQLDQSSDHSSLTDEFCEQDMTVNSDNHWQQTVNNMYKQVAQLWQRCAKLDTSSINV